MKRFILPALAILGVVLRVIPIWALPTWYDENFTLVLARLPLDRLIAATAGDVHPPLWYLICHLMEDIQGLPGWAVIRFPALLFSLASMLVFWKICKASINFQSIRLVAFGLFAILPTQIYYAQEGRMYSLLTLLVLTAWLCILECDWFGVFLSCALMVWLHNYGLIYCVVIWIAMIVAERKRNRGSSIDWDDIIKNTFAIGLACLTFLPWAIVLVSQMVSIEGNYWIVRVNLVSILTDIFHSTFAGGMAAPDMYNLAVFFGMIVWSIYQSIRNHILDLPTVVLAFGTTVLAAVISLVWQPMMLYRALVPASAFIVLLIANNAEYLFSVPRRALFAAVLFLPALLVNVGSVLYRAHWPTSLQETAATMQMIDEQWQDGDLLYHADDGIFITGSAVWKNVDNTLRVPVCGPVLGGLTNATREAIGETTGLLTDDYHGRIWVVTSETPMNPACETETLQEAGLLEGEPLTCMVDNDVVSSCVWLVER